LVDLAIAANGLLINLTVLFPPLDQHFGLPVLEKIPDNLEVLFDYSLPCWFEFSKKIPTSFISRFPSLFQALENFKLIKTLNEII
jgi:hypothetical protein